MTLVFLNCYNYVVMNCTNIPAPNSVPSTAIPAQTKGGHDAAAPTPPGTTATPAVAVDNTKRNMTIVGSIIVLVVVVALLVFAFAGNKNSSKEDKE